MKHVLIPIDFSNISKNAAIYAANMAQKATDIHLYFYHSYKFANIEAVTTSVEEDAAASMYLFIQELLASFPDLKYSQILDNQLLMQGIQSIIANNNIDLVIMGARGKSVLAQKLIGSNTITVAQEIDKPVLIIPAIATYQDITTMLVALPFKTDPLLIATIKNLIKIKHDWKLALKFATVESSVQAATMLEIFSQQQSIIDELKELHNNYVVLDNDDVASSMFAYADKENISWLCTYVQEKGFWERLINGSVTSKLSTISNKPIMVINKKTTIK